jgi:type I restriction enzyme R subunit
MADKEAAARIKINKLLEAAGWRFFPSESTPANICLEPCVTIKSTDLDALGDNFEKTGKGYIDFLLLDTKGFPFIVLEVSLTGIMEPRMIGVLEPAGRGQKRVSTTWPI